MLITIIALILAIIPGSTKHGDVVVIPPKPDYAPIVFESDVTDEYVSAYEMALIEFSMIFENVEIKHAKNGSLMVRGIHSKSFKFAKRG